MESVINTEDRLRVIKTIFELSIEAKVFPDEIFIYSSHQKWEVVSNLRAELLVLKMNDLRHKKTIDIIYGLTKEIICLFNQIRGFEEEVERENIYKINCTSTGNKLIKHKIESDNGNEAEFINGKWFPFRDFNYDEKSDFIFTTPLFLIHFVFQIHEFIKERIIIDPKTLNSSKSPSDNKNPKYTVKGIIMAYYYMHRKNIYPINELKGVWVLKNIHKELENIYGLSANSFKNDWNPIISSKDERLQRPSTIKESIEILKTFTFTNIQDAIDLATDELNKAELIKN